MGLNTVDNVEKVLVKDEARRKEIRSFIRNTVGALLLVAGVHIGMEVIARDIVKKIEEVAEAITNATIRLILEEVSTGGGICRDDECDRTG